MCISTQSGPNLPSDTSIFSRVQERDCTCTAGVATAERARSSPPCWGGCTVCLPTPPCTTPSSSTMRGGFLRACARPKLRSKFRRWGTEAGGFGAVSIKSLNDRVSRGTSTPLHPPHLSRCAGCSQIPHPNASSWRLVSRVRRAASLRPLLIPRGRPLVRRPKCCPLRDRSSRWAPRMAPRGGWPRRGPWAPARPPAQSP